MVHTHGKALNIWPITPSRTHACISPEFFSRFTRISACCWVKILWKSISILRFSQALYSFVNRVPRPIPINVLKASSSSAFERHNTASSSLEYNSLKVSQRMATGKHLQQVSDLGSTLTIVEEMFDRYLHRHGSRRHKSLRFSPAK